MGKIQHGFPTGPCAQQHVSPRWALAAFPDRVGTPQSLLTPGPAGIHPLPPWSGPAAKQLAKPSPLRSLIPALPKQVCWLKLRHSALCRRAVWLLPPAQIGCTQPSLPEGTAGWHSLPEHSLILSQGWRHPLNPVRRYPNFCSRLLLEQKLISKQGQSERWKICPSHPPQ